MDTEYNIIQPPVPIRFKEIDRTQAKVYFEWFLNQFSVRTNELTHYVQMTSQYEQWKSDFSPASLDELGKWFFQHVKTKQRSDVEIEEIYSKAPRWFRNIPISDYELTIATVSLSIDVGLYLSQVIKKNVEGLHWEMVTRPKSSHDYQQPVLVGKGKLTCNPVDLVLVYANGIANGTKGPERLKELYEIWANILVE